MSGLFLHDLVWQWLGATLLLATLFLVILNRAWRRLDRGNDRVRRLRLVIMAGLFAVLPVGTLSVAGWLSVIAANLSLLTLTVLATFMWRGRMPRLGSPLLIILWLGFLLLVLDLGGYQPTGLWDYGYAGTGLAPQSFAIAALVLVVLAALARTEPVLALVVAAAVLFWAAGLMPGLNIIAIFFDLPMFLAVSAALVNRAVRALLLLVRPTTPTR